ncbi:MAG TPA: decarboxylating 6-phosphogluconate dehydrogenase, partial [Bacillales bacterium]|nr:decarboxylating 6-phosphogluconate dehydrogenase [Bacillales bacterium]
MNIGLIGLGKMGFNLGEQMMEKGYEVAACDINKESVDRFAETGAFAAYSLAELVDNLQRPRVMWVMVPAGKVTNEVIRELSGLLKPGDIVIDGGNTHYKETLSHNELLSKKGIYFFDAGTSGGTSGAREGACFMIGGNEKVFKEIEPLFRDLSVENGYLYTGRAGSGHFLKMVHNGIEYGMMAAIGEGFEILEKSPFDYDYKEVARVWNHGSVIRSW